MLFLYPAYLAVFLFGLKFPITVPIQVIAHLRVTTLLLSVKYWSGSVKYFLVM